MTVKTITNDDVQKILRESWGTEHYYKTMFSSHMVYTDGIKNMAEKLSCCWLIDTIVSHVPKVVKQFNESNENFYVVKLSVDDGHRALFTVTYEQYDEDGNMEEKCIAMQDIPYADLPECEIKLYLELASIEPVIFCLLCPSEH